MSAADLVAVLLGVAALAVTAALAVITAMMLRTLRQLRTDVRHLADEIDDTVDHLHAAIGRADDDIKRADTVLGAIEEVSDRVDAASELAYETFSKPVIKAVSFGSGTARAARRLRRKE